MNMQIISELTQLNELVNNEPRMLDRESKMKKQKINPGVALIIIMTLALFLTAF